MRTSCDRCGRALDDERDGWTWVGAPGDESVARCDQCTDDEEEYRRARETIRRGYRGRDGFEAD